MTDWPLVGRIERRLLVNYRADLDIVRNLVPSGLRPTVVSGSALVGICLLRVGELRPRGLPAAIGVGSENAAHRIAVDWGPLDDPTHGVYIPVRHSESVLSTLVGGRLYPGVHRRAAFEVDELSGSVHVAMQSLDSTTSVSVRSSAGGAFQSELFGGLGAASSVFECAPVGISPRRDGSLEAVRMVTKRWEIDSVQLDDVTSSYFDDASRFPAGTISFDSALLMRGVEVEWRRHPLHLQG